MPVFSPDSRIGRAIQRTATSPAFRRIGPKVVPPLDRALSRVSGGRLLISKFMVPSLVLESTGRRSGLTRRTPLACIPEDGGWYVVGSNFGREHHPAWTANLIAEPSASIAWGKDTIAVDARLLAAEEKAEVWPRLIARWPAYDDYVEASGRDLRVFHLTAAESGGSGPS